MTVSINGMTVEIKAKNLGEDKFNKAATQRILNYLSMVMTEAYDGNKKMGIDEYWLKDDATEIYNTLKKQGYYAGC